MDADKQGFTITGQYMCHGHMREGGKMTTKCTAHEMCQDRERTKRDLDGEKK